jgi:hypothetical protein
MTQCDSTEFAVYQCHSSGCLMLMCSTVTIKKETTSTKASPTDVSEEPTATPSTLCFCRPSDQSFQLEPGFLSVVRLAVLPQSV